MAQARNRIVVCILALYLWMPTSQAEVVSRQEIYGGVVANQTVTVAGQDFYQSFVAAWRDRDLSERFSISIHERPSARWGSQVWIEFAQRRIFQAALPTGRGGIRSLAEQAIEVAYQLIGEAEVDRLLFRDVDVGPDEM
jgi:curli production assembly/transport component CsgE